MRDWSASGVRYLKGVGPKVAEKLAKLGIQTQRDLLFHLPIRYEDRTRITPIGALQPGQKCLIQGEVLYVSTGFRRRGPSRRVLTAKLADNTGVMTMRLFFFNARQQQLLEKGNCLRCFGEARLAMGEMEMIHPQLELIDVNKPTPLSKNLTPVYPTTDGLHQIAISKIIRQVVDRLAESIIPETLPQDWLTANRLPDFTSAMLSLHRPETKKDTQLIAARCHPAQHRFVVEELCAHRLTMLQRRKASRARKTPHIKVSKHVLNGLLQSLPFELTAAQRRAIADVLRDFESGKPMMRLLQGDVGSGKTVVAALACLPALESGFQCALMAPTEILAEQHFQNFKNWFEPLQIPVISLVGADKGKKRKTKLDNIRQGKSAVVIGTHALFQASVEFHALGFIIIDEQHRFGVDQRLALQKKTLREEMPHQLIMTATPIPRTLAMSIYADLDYTQIDELPPGRKPVKTSIIAEHQRKSLIDRVAKSCLQGGQVYWVCTLIEESEALQCEAAEATWMTLQQQLPDLTIALVHGRMKAAEKEAVIHSFKKGQTHILVATTVIEVGVDVPNASIMIIENPERLGLSQIHQLRGRVGRGSRESYCILLVKDSLSALSRQRLDTIRRHHDGFKIAEKDLELRGAGEVLGTRQTGEMNFKIADILRDQKWFNEVEALAKLMQQEAYAEMREQLLQNWVGNRGAYTAVG